VRETARQLGIPGVAVGVLRNGAASFDCWGVTSFDNPLPITETTIFQLASISKTFVGTTAMVLVDQNVLDLDEPIVTYVPALQLSSDELTAHVTMRHLLTHRGGWVGDYFADTGQGDDALALFVKKLAKAPQLTPLGTMYSYSNSAFNLAAHVIATITQSPYEHAVRDLVLRPLGMHDTLYTTEEAIVRRVAIGHRDGHPQPWRRPRAHAGASNVLSSAADLLTFAQFHLGDGFPLLRNSQLALRNQPVVSAGSLSDGIALVWRVDTYNGHTVWHHGGSNFGYESELRMLPELELAWVMLTNSNHDHQLDSAVMTSVVGPVVEVPPFVPPSLQDFPGTYTAVLATLHVAADNDQLVMDVNGRRTRLAFRDPDRVVALDAPYKGNRGEFIRDDTGTIEWLRWDGRIARREP
jgi:CubicO group peptidase (beta-lactamase class C family)